MQDGHIWGRASIKCAMFIIVVAVDGGKDHYCSVAAVISYQPARRIQTTVCSEINTHPQG